MSSIKLLTFASATESQSLFGIRSYSVVNGGDHRRALFGYGVLVWGMPYSEAIGRNILESDYLCHQRIELLGESLSDSDIFIHPLAIM
ncbi:hypothetical protein B0G84_7737 [Paraburkholderia sp. BL8N3]|nr:hypothetical protein B0G84_7737 [Paraburkholderia sp. BL8N3]